MKQPDPARPEDHGEKLDFLSNMSHELCTPLNVVIGMSYLLLKTNLDSKQRDYVENIHYSGQALQEIIQDILDYSKLQAGVIKAEPVDFELSEFIDQLVRATRQKLAGKNLKLSVDIDERVPEKIEGDPVRIKQVLLNYISNAIKFTKQGGITFSIQHLEENGDRLILRFAVQDTGIGLTAEQQEKLFQPFQQIDTSMTRKYGGTGIGLSLAKQLATLMNGTVGAESISGQGSNFWLAIPVVKKSMDSQSQPDEQKVCSGRALVVDDNKLARDMMTDMLKTLSIEVQVSASGEAALQAVREAERIGKPYDLAFIDWKMPGGMDGIETCRQISELSLSKPLYTVMVTAYGRDELLRKMDKAGVKQILNKPVIDRQLYDIVTKVFNSNPKACRLAGENQVYGRFMKNLAEIEGSRILLVDDNRLNQQIVVELLKEGKFLVDVAVNGQAAVEMVKNKSYDLVFMDVQMPVLDGIAATKEIRRDLRFDFLPIIAMTANTMNRDRMNCLAAGMNDFIAKPLNPDAVFAALLRWIPSRIVTNQPHSYLSTVKMPTGLGDVGSEEHDLRAVRGLDVTEGLKRTLNKTDIYKKLLKTFANEQADTVTTIRQHLASGDQQAAERAAHTLKGTAGTIGAKEIQQQAAELESALRHFASPQEIFYLMATLEPMLQALTTRLRQLLSVSEPKQQPLAVTDREKTKQLIEQLENLLADDDSEAATLFEQEKATLETIWPQEFSRFSEAMQTFDFVEALKLLQEMKQQGYRITINNIHYVQCGDELVPAGETEFVQDKTFGYR